MENAKSMVRPITQADTVMAVYHEDFGMRAWGRPDLIFAAWPDGQVVWSRHRLRGGPPYYVGDVGSQNDHCHASTS